MGPKASHQALLSAMSDTDCSVGPALTRHQMGQKPPGRPHQGSHPGSHYGVPGLHRSSFFLEPLGVSSQQPSL